MAKKEGSTKKKSSSSSDMKQLQARLEAIEAKQAAHEEIRGLSEKKFDHLTEQIGELKELFKVLEEDKKDLEVQISSTVKKVESTQPQELSKNYQELAGSVEKLDGKFSLLSKQYENFTQRFESFEHKLKVFKGEEELLKLQQNVKKELLEIEKVSHTAHKHASKIENHYIKINEKVNDAVGAVEQNKEVLSQLEDLRDELQRTLDVAHEGPEGRIAALEETVDDLSKIMIDTFEKLKGKHQEHEAAISRLKAPTATVSDEELSHMKEWLLYLIEAHQKH